jgi:CDP-diacylglycerol--glycerol-3-phosphate 3-phosphatidyltransferase
VLFALLRDIMIFIGAGYVKFRYSVVTTSLWPGKWAVGFVSMMFIAMVWPHPVFKLYHVKEFFLYLSTVMLLYSFFQYSVRFHKIHKGIDCSG